VGAVPEEPASDTVAVNITAVPNAWGFAELVTDVVLAPIEIDWIIVGPSLPRPSVVLQLKLVSPLYVALIVCGLGAAKLRLLVTTFAVAVWAPVEVSGPDVPIVVTPSAINVTFPLSVKPVAPVSVTVTVNVTDCPKVDDPDALVNAMEVVFAPPVHVARAEMVVPRTRTKAKNIMRSLPTDGMRRDMKSP
jgi:hypothetical protein